MTFEATDYRVLVRERVRKRRAEGAKVTLTAIAAKLGIQYTYLSKVLQTGSKGHLNDDHLGELCDLLGMGEDEIDYVFLLKQLATSSNRKRRERLAQKIDKLVASVRLNVPLVELDKRRLENDTRYLLDPHTVLVHTALTVPRFARHPSLLVEAMGIEKPRLQAILDFLALVGFIEIDAKSRKVTKVNRRQSHIGPDHPLVQSHQAHIKSLSTIRLMNLRPDQRKSFMVTFGTNEKSFGEIRKAFDDFVERVRALSGKGEADNLYQMNFELLPWTD